MFAARAQKYKKELWGNLETFDIPTEKFPQTQTMLLVLQQ